MVKEDTEDTILSIVYRQYNSTVLLHCVPGIFSRRTAIPVFWFLFHLCLYFLYSLDTIFNSKMYLHRLSEFYKLPNKLVIEYRLHGIKRKIPNFKKQCKSYHPQRPASCMMASVIRVDTVTFVIKAAHCKVWFTMTSALRVKSQFLFSVRLLSFTWGNCC